MTSWPNFRTPKLSEKILKFRPLARGRKIIRRIFCIFSVFPNQTGGPGSGSGASVIFSFFGTWILARATPGFEPHGVREERVKTEGGEFKKIEIWSCK